MTKQEEQKIKAVELLKKLNIYKPYIDEFEKENVVCYFENYGGFWAWQDKELIDKIAELETAHDCKVYAITHEYTRIGEMYSFLIVTKYKREWRTLIQSNGNEHIAFAYVWNKSDDYCSEFGSVMVKSFGGGLKRIG